MYDPAKHAMVRLDRTLTDQLAILAAQNHRSLTAEINRLIEKELQTQSENTSYE